MIKILKSSVQGCAVLLGTQPHDGQLPSHAERIPKDRRLLRGIPQGSRFSPFLCALHMGAGDARLPPAVAESLRSGQSALARLVDDFLYVSTEPSSCCQFLSCLAKENNPYGGDLNWQKCAANFAFQWMQQGFVARSDAASSSSEVPWAGLTLAPSKGFLNVRQGTKRRITDLLTVKRKGKVPVWEGAIRSKLLVFLKMKLQPLLLDPRLNSQDCIKVRGTECGEHNLFQPIILVNRTHCFAGQKLPLTWL